MVSVAVTRYDRGLRQTRHAHEHHTVSLVLAGGLRERVGREEEVAGPLSIVVKPAGTEHQNEFGNEPTRLLRLTLDRELSRECTWVAQDLTRWRWHTASPAAPAFLSLLRRVRSPRPADQAAIGDAALEALAAIGAEHRALPPGTPPLWLQVVRERVADTERPSVADLAREAGVHPVYLARQFRRWYGSSIRDHLRRRRAQRAAAALAARSTISAASYDAGFADHAHLCRVFKGATGLTPASYRTLIDAEV